MQMPLVSAVIPVYRSERTILRALESVAAQSYPNLELVIVDDGSTDGSAQLIARFIAEHPGMSVQSLCHPNHGVSYTRNQGILAAKGEYIAFLDADDYWYPQKTAEQMSFLLQQKQVLVSCLLQNFKQQAPFTVYRLNDMLLKNPICTSGTIAKKDVLVEAGLFDTTMQYCEDYNLWLKIAVRHPVCVLNRQLIVYEDLAANPNKQGLSTKLKQMEQGELSNYRWLWRNGHISKTQHIKASVVSYLKHLKRVMRQKLKK